MDMMKSLLQSLEERTGGRNTKIQCWTYGTAEHFRRNSPTSRDGGNKLPLHQGKIIFDHLVRRRCPESQKPHFKVFHISSISGGDNVFFIMGHINKVLCRMIIDPGASVTIIRTDLAQKFEDLDSALHYPPDCDTINVHGKVRLNIAFEDAMYHHMSSAADINNQFILKFDFLKKQIQVGY
ncbi:retrovirus-related Pol polyprotein from transposon 412 [Nephila pilipes]|uniref:Retrovirus-related Pol polyprotein from transposon 412 n=1 Tax=Nephila pilipes TaxID=299642 RepID=A0A8X6P4Z0_NEPPI|nr:retrovirus-related Pol polyprotein from transposon 412 [Nephila pilipes]